MITDSFFEQGVSHEVCEDYALHGDGYAIIADGCSNGGGPRVDSDWGARLICKAAEEQVGQFDPSVLIPLVGSRAKMLMQSLPNLQPPCLLATLLMLRVFGPDYHAFMVGDGVVGGKRKDGRWKIHIVNFTKGPFYLKYNIYGEEAGFIEAFGDKYTVETYFGRLMDPDLAPPDQPEIADRIDAWSQIMSYSEKEHVFDPATPFHLFEFPIDEYEFAFICSDGAQSFYQPRITDLKKYNENIYVLDSLRLLLDFVTIRPGFARLQRNWAFKQDKQGTFTRRRWKNSDDVSVGVIHGA